MFNAKEHLQDNREVGIFYILFSSYFCKDIGYQFPLDTHISMLVFVLWREWRLDSLLLYTQISFRNAKEQ